MDAFTKWCAFALFSIVPAGVVADPDSQISATGHVEFVNTTTQNHLRASFNAITHQDGTVSGEFEEHVESSTGDFVRRTHGIITCLTVSGNVARFGGVITESSGNAAPPGTEIFATVVDNGEGANDPDDLASPGGSGNPGVALRHCTAGLFRPLFPITAGNVQVRPSGL